MGKVLALDVDACAAELAGQVLSVVQRRGPSNVVTRKKLKPRLELLVGLGRLVLDLKLMDRAHQRFRDKHPAELTESASFVWQHL